jgi:hypothetical protein
MGIYCDFYETSPSHILAKKMFWTNDLEKKKTKRYALFAEFTLRRMVVSYRRFGTTYRSNFQGSSSPRRNTHDMRYVSVHFWALKII